MRGRGRPRAPSESWFRAADAADDIELIRRLYGWKLASTPWKKRDAVWRDEVMRRFAAARTPAERFLALAKVDTGWMALDAKTALALYEIDPAGARSFITSHLPWFGWLGTKRSEWDELLARSREGDAEFHFELYRRVADDKRWRADAIAQCRAVIDPGALDAELERRHPQGHLADAADVFHELIVARTDRRLAGLAKRHGFAYTRYADDLTFSGANRDAAHRLRRAAEQVIRDEGFTVNQAKTRVMTPGGRKIVTGVTVNTVLGLSRKRRRVIRAMLHHARTHGADAKQRAELDGLLAYVHMLNPAQAAALRKQR